MGGLSAHADRDALLDWLSHFRQPPRTYVVHGEATSAEAFAAAIGQHYGWPAVNVARKNERVDLRQA